MKNSFRKKISFTFLFIVFAISIGMIPSVPEEGMYPLSEIQNVDLVDAGLKIDPVEVYNPNGVSLIDALVKVNGCTGSFVSNEGLIITNHHCAFGAISAVSTPEDNYLENGFLAPTREDEVPAPGYSVRITESYEDVSDQVLKSVEGVTDLSERSKLIAAKMREIGKAATDEENSIEGRVSEMFIGKTYILFKYRLIRDVRLVYAPPRSIGEFGGETDNWIWPRHTGDFSFMRAYVAKDGSAADFSLDNVPYTPKKFLKINPNGVKEGDFVFILGYPGRTYRHRPSQFLQFQQYYQLPYISQIYDWMIDEMESIAGDDDALKLKYARFIKGLANTKKNYQGKLKGLRRIELVDKKIAEEKLLQEFINGNDELKSEYGNLLDEIDTVYQNQFAMGKSSLWMSRFTRFSNRMALAKQILDYQEKMLDPKFEDNDSLRTEYEEKLRGRISQSHNSFDPPFEKPFIVKMLQDAAKFEGDAKIEAINLIPVEGDINESIQKFVDNVFEDSDLMDPEFISEVMEGSIDDLADYEDDFLTFAKKVFEQDEKIEKAESEIDGSLNKLLAQYVDVKKEWKQTAFIPDANSTLRLTYGHISGYEPADATYYHPITTLDGIIDKNLTGVPEYKIPEKLRNLYKNKTFGKYYDAEAGGVPTGILYNMDTTGGNSGSPIMDAYGNLIGVNFDRAYEATINDYAWNESYSRSIGVDIRYVLWVTQYVGEANHLIKEMGVEL